MKFYLKQKLTKGYEILDENKIKAYDVIPAFTFITTRVSLHDNNNKSLYDIQSKPFRIFPCYKVYKGVELLYVFKKKFTFFKKRIKIKAKSPEEKGNKYKLRGSFLGLNFYVKCNGETIFTLDKKQIIGIKDSYLLDVIDEDKKEFAIISSIIISLIYHLGAGSR